MQRGKALAFDRWPKPAFHCQLDGSQRNSTAIPMKSDVPTKRGTAIRQFSVMLENRVGALSSLVGLLREANIHVLGLSLVDSVDVTIARLVLSDPDSVMALFIEKGIPHSVCDMVVVVLPHGSESLSDCLRALLLAETNIHFSYALLVRHEDRPLLALHLEDAEFGMAVLHQNGFRTLGQEDISR